VEISLVFFTAGTIILVGFLGGLLFEKTKIPDVIILLGIGVLLSPALNFMEAENLFHFAEYFGSFALMVILFDGGMDIDIRKLIRGFGTAVLLVILTFLFSVLAVAAFLYFVQGWEGMRSVLLGTIVGCTSAAIVIPIVQKMTLREEIKIVISIESALSDVLAVVLAVSLLEFLKLERIGITGPFRAVASSFSIAIVLGIVSGMLWLKVQDFFEEKRCTYMITLAVLLLVFALVDFFGGSGPIAILIFGIILGNGRDFAKFLKLKGGGLCDETVRFFHGEVTFFIRTFFFVYMGVLFSFRLINLQFLVLSISLVAILTAVRYFSVYTISVIDREKKDDRLVIFSMLPRGLASAVLATLPVSANIKGCEGFVDYTFAVIILTNVIMTVGVFVIERGKRLETAKGG
jgi:Na+:H+ antiporter